MKICSRREFLAGMGQGMLIASVGSAAQGACELSGVS